MAHHLFSALSSALFYTTLTWIPPTYAEAGWSSGETGGLLRELWSEGQRLDAHDMLKQVTGTEIELEAVAERIREHLK